MAYPRKLLNQNEEVVLDLHPHWRIFIAPGLLVIIALAGGAAALRFTGVEPRVAYIAGAVIGGFGLLWLIGRLLVWATTDFVVTTDRLIYRAGVLSKRGVEIQLERLDSISFSQSILERLLRVGDLRIESAGESGQQNFSDIGSPARVQNQIYQTLEHAQERDARRASGGGQVSVAEELERLEGLRVKGVITQQEFDAQKARLLTGG